jgi:ABC-2 type transport system permease protein|tara:strand:- start:11773 stop:12501 length:729 start_codon:yes stop_codon:yes gene_type:complete
MKAIIKKELKLFLSNQLSIVTICVLLLLYGLILFTNLFNLNLLDNGYANLDSFFNLSPLIFMIYIPAITMRSFSEEYKNGTIEILLSKPISTLKLIFSKFLSVYIIIVLSIIPTLIYPLSIYLLGEEVGNIDMGGTIGSYLGLFLLCSIFTSISIFSSSLTKHQVNAFLIALLLNIFIYYGIDIIGQFINNGNISLVITKSGILHHYELLSKGLISFNDIVYFISVSYLFLIFTNHIITIKK